MKTITDFISRRYAVIFFHSEGWTISSIHERQLDAKVQMREDKQSLPTFKYKVVKLNPISFNLLQS